MVAHWAFRNAFQLVFVDRSGAELALEAGEMLGLPVAQYMEGSVAVGMVNQLYLETHPLRVID